MHRIIVTAMLLALATPSWALDLSGVLNQQQLEKFGKALESHNEGAASSVAPADSADALAQFSQKDQVGSLKQALSQGAEAAVADLAKQNGYLGNEKVRIPLPENLQKAEKLMRQFGMGKHADELVTSMNRAAEAAVPEAKTLLLGAVKKMTFADAKNILMGENDAATQFFRKNTESDLLGRFKPIVEKSMQKVQLAQTYNNFAGKGVKYGLVTEQDADLSNYITRKALDGLFLMMAEQEQAIRENPLQATGALAKKVFSAMRL